MDHLSIITTVAAVATLGVAMWAVYLANGTTKVLENSDEHLERMEGILSDSEDILSRTEDITNTNMEITAGMHDILDTTLKIHAGRAMRDIIIEAKASENPWETFKDGMQLYFQVPKEAWEFLEELDKYALDQG